jgi:transposase InsO family protein
VKPSQVNELYQAAFIELPIVGRRMHSVLAVLDSLSRYLLALRVSTSATTQTLIEGLEDALREAHRASWLDNNRKVGVVTDRDSTTTSPEFSNYILGTPFLHIFGTTRTFPSLGMIRRLAWTFKDEEISLHNYQDPAEAQYSLERFRRTYNFERPHQALRYFVPAADLFCTKPRS